MFCVSLVFFGQVFFHDEVVDDEALSFHGVLSHVVFQQTTDIVAFVERDGLESHVGTDEVFELVGRDFPESFESRDFGVGREFLNGSETLFFGVAIDCLKLGAVRVARLFENGFSGSVWLFRPNVLGGAHLFLLVTDAEERGLGI